jgi:hypothetical protein
MRKVQNGVDQQLEPRTPTESLELGVLGVGVLGVGVLGAGVMGRGALGVGVAMGWL